MIVIKNAGGDEPPALQFNSENQEAFGNAVSPA